VKTLLLQTIPMCLAAAMLLSGCTPAPSTFPPATPSSTTLPTSTPQPTATRTLTPTFSPQPDSLRALARDRGFLIGAAMSLDPVLAKRPDARDYLDTLAREFNILTVEHVMKFEPIHPQPETYDFSKADYVVAFAEAHDMAVIGHTLVWQQVLPTWLQDVECNRDTFIQILQDHIHTVVGHYRGRVLTWDVVNEAVRDDGSLDSTIWLKCIGPDYIDMAYRWAHQADPAALLFYNDYGGEGLGPRSDAIYGLVKTLKEGGTPIDGVGFQMHIDVDHFPDPADVAINMERYAQLGLQVHISEMDVAIDIPVTEEKLARQADLYRRMLAVCLDAPNCTGFVMWGFTDAQSWIPAYFQGYDSGLVFDSSYQPKPAYYAVKEELGR
jgi:endo-1,4-beta-xylanase